MSKPKELSSATFNGVANLKHQEFKKLTIHGSAHFTDVDAQDLHVSGAICAQDCTFEKVEISGAVDFKNSSVLQNLVVHGGCNVTDSKLCDVVVRGGLCAEDSKITGKTVVAGGASFNHCAVNDFVTNGTNSEFKESDVAGNILIEKSDSGSFFSLFRSAKKQEIKLVGTVVHGDVTFEKEGGIVILKDSSKILGKIVNGTVA